MILFNLTPNLSQFTGELERLRATLDRETAGLAERLDQGHLQAQLHILRYTQELMQAQRQYFERGLQIFQSLDPRMQVHPYLVRILSRFSFFPVPNPHIIRAHCRP